MFWYYLSQKCNSGIYSVIISNNHRIHSFTQRYKIEIKQRILSFWKVMKEKQELIELNL